MALSYGNVKKPPVVMRLIPDFQNGAWDVLGPRNPVGIVSHTMVGTLKGTDQYFRRGAASTGLTDFGIGKDGTIYQWNDPFGGEHWVKLYVDGNGWTVYSDSGQSYKCTGNKAGWANGGSDGLEGDGPLFVRTLGVNAINRDLVSIERDDQADPYNNPFVDPQFASFVKLVAWIYDTIKVPWNTFPVNPNLVIDLVTYFWHLEFATKGCPHKPVIDRTNDAQNAIRGLLKAGQESGALPIPIEPPTPPAPDHTALPMDYTLAGLKERFGKLKHRKPDGTEELLGFNIKGAISNAWIARGAAEKRKMADLPPASYFAEVDNPKVMIGNAPGTEGVVLFDGRGADNWVLSRPDNSIAFRWMI